MLGLPPIWARYGGMLEEWEVELGPEGGRCIGRIGEDVAVSWDGFR